MRKRKTIPELVKQYAEAWRDDMLGLDERAAHGYRERNPLKEHVREYMDGIFRGLLNRLMGVKKDWDRIELIEPCKGEPPTVASILMEKSLPHLLELGEQLFATADIKLSQKDIARLRKQYRDHLLESLEDRIKELAEARAHEIAENELDRFMADDEWVALLEGRFAPKAAPSEELDG